MNKNKTISTTGKIISHPFAQFIVQTAMALSGNPEIMKYSGAVGIVQAEFSAFTNSLLSDIQSDSQIDFDKLDERTTSYFASKVLREVYFEDSKEKKIKYRNLILTSLETTDFDNDLSKEHLTTLTQIGEKELAILKQAMILKSNKNGFINEFDYWEVNKEFEKIGLFTKEEYQGYINHLIGLGLINHGQMSLIGGDKSVYTVTQKGISFFGYIKLGNSD